MKAEELMIGDWVLCDINAQSDYEFDNVNYQPYQIENGEDIDYSIEKNMICDADVYQPMPLTKEILEKNGFKVYNRYIWEQRDNYCRVRLNIAPKIEIDGEIFGESPILLQIDGATFSLNIIIEYVHELQHALRLCGIEKEIIL